MDRAGGFHALVTVLVVGARGQGDIASCKEDESPSQQISLIPVGKTLQSGVSWEPLSDVVLMIVLLKVAASRLHEKVVDDLVKANSLLKTRKPVLDRTDRPFDFDFEAGFLAYFASRRLLDGFPIDWGSLGQAPEAFLDSANQHHPRPILIPLVDNSARGDEILNAEPAVGTWHECRIPF
jgi:hypothetical protein